MQELMDRASIPEARMEVRLRGIIVVGEFREDP